MRKNVVNLHDLRPFLPYIKAVDGFVLENDFWTPHPSYQFCTRPFTFQQIYYYLFRVRLDSDTFWAERRG